MKTMFLLFILLSSFIQATEVKQKKDNNIYMINTKENFSEICIQKSLKGIEVQRRGCCSWHGGVAGCSSGRIVCSDGTYSPSCTCNRSINPLG